MIAATEVPLWTTLLFGVAAGLLGALLAITHARSVEFRTRMLDAANDFLKALTVASGRIVDVENILVGEERLTEDELDAAFRRLEVARDEALSGLARIDLLFGRTTQTWVSAARADRAVQDAVESLRRLRAGDSRAEDRVVFHGDTFQAAVDDFGAAVRADFQGLGSRLPRWARSVRAALQRSTVRLTRWLQQFRYRVAR